MTVYFLRHAQKAKGSYFNPSLRHQDPPISRPGANGARRLTGYFCTKSISAVYVSQYLRTMQTAQQICKGLHITPRVDPRLNEIDNGVLDGMDDVEIQERFPEIWDAYVQRDRDFQFPEGETGTEALLRITSFLAKISTSKRDVLCVTHEGLMRLLVCSVLGLEVYRRWEFEIDYLGIVELEIKDKKAAWHLKRLNQVVGD
jgi:broad specificity phosphatase PhoE